MKWYFFMWYFLLFKNMCGWVMLNEKSSNDGLSIVSTLYYICIEFVLLYTFLVISFVQLIWQIFLVNFLIYYLLLLYLHKSIYTFKSIVFFFWSTLAFGLALILNSKVLCFLSASPHLILPLKILLPKDFIFSNFHKLKVCLFVSYKSNLFYQFFLLFYEFHLILF